MSGFEFKRSRHKDVIHLLYNFVKKEKDVKRYNNTYE